jgi:thioredoxin 1
MSTKELTSADFQGTIENGVALVDFYADWCMPCRMLAPTISSLADDFAGKATIAKINIDKSPDIAAKFGVMNIPTVILFKDGKQIDKKVGGSPKAVYENMINTVL